MLKADGKMAIQAITFADQRYAAARDSVDFIQRYIFPGGSLPSVAVIADHLARLDYLNDPEATEKAEELKAMDISCDAAIIFAERHAELAEKMAREESDSVRRAELEQIASICRQVPAHAPHNFAEALQAYWFVHLGTITELNGWDAMSPGHLDQHLAVPNGHIRLKPQRVIGGNRSDQQGPTQQQRLHR